MVREDEKIIACKGDDLILEAGFQMKPPKKHLGQHFLHDKNIIEKIIKSICPKSSDHFIEIGPGYGALTRALLPHVNKIDAIELDKDVIPELKKNCNHLGNLTVHHLDALKLDINAISKNQTFRIAGNLPYQISTPLIFHLIDQIENITDMHFMLQKEVVDRITAEPASKIYGRLSVMVQYYCKTAYLFFVPPTAFTPPPKVDSAVLRLNPYKEKPFVAKDENKFAIIVRECFNHRRKTIRNTLKNFIDINELERINIDPQLLAD